MAIALESEAAFSDRLSKIGISQNVKTSLLRQGFTTFGSLAFAISTTPAQMTDAAFESWVQKVHPDPLEPFQIACIRRLVFESHALALSDMQRKVDPVSEGLGLGHKKLPIAERQARQREQELRLTGLVLSPETLPSHTLVDTCVNMVDTQVLVWIKPEECTSRAQEIQSVKKDARLTLDNDGSLKMSAKTPAAVCQVSSELDLRNAFQRRSLALEQARVCSFRVIEKWVQHLFLAHGRSQPAGFANVTLSQMIECDKQLLLRHRTSWWAISQQSLGSPNLWTRWSTACRLPMSYSSSWCHCPARAKIRTREKTMSRAMIHHQSKPRAKASKKANPRERELSPLRVPYPFRQAALPKRLRGNRCVSDSIVVPANSKEVVRVVDVDFICASKRAVTGHAHTMNAVTPSDSRRSQPFHHPRAIPMRHRSRPAIIQLLPLKSVAGKLHCPGPSWIQVLLCLVSITKFLQTLRRPSQFWIWHVLATNKFCKTSLPTNPHSTSILDSHVGHVPGPETAQLVRHFNRKELQIQRNYDQLNFRWDCLAFPQGPSTMPESLKPTYCMTLQWSSSTCSWPWIVWSVLKTPRDPGFGLQWFSSSCAAGCSPPYQLGINSTMSILTPVVLAPLVKNLQDGSQLLGSLQPWGKSAPVITNMSHIKSLQLMGAGSSTRLEKPPMDNLYARLSQHAWWDFSRSRAFSLNLDHRLDTLL